jgi:hypothetical protein
LKKRYEDLINWQKTGAVKSLLEAEESAKVLLEVIEMRKKITPLLKNAGMTSQGRTMLQEFSTNNVAFGEIAFNGFGAKPYISISGKEVTNYFIKNGGEITLDGKEYLVIKNAPKNESRYFEATRGLQDSETKLIEYAGERIQNIHKFAFNVAENTKKVEGIKLNMTMTSEMKSCSSCEVIINKFNSINHNNKLSFRGGTKYIENGQ